MRIQKNLDIFEVVNKQLSIVIVAKEIEQKRIRNSEKGSRKIGISSMKKSEKRMKKEVTAGLYKKKLDFTYKRAEDKLIDYAIMQRG